EPVGQIDAIRSLDSGYTEPVPIDADRGDHTHVVYLAIELRQGRTQHDVRDCQRHQDQCRTGNHDIPGLHFSRATLRMSMALVPRTTPESSPLVRMTRSFFFTSCRSSNRVNRSRYRTSVESGSVTSKITG